MRVLVVSHTYIVDLNCEKFRTLAHLEPGIEVTIAVPKRWRPGGVQNRIIETRAWQDGTFRVVPVSNLSQNNQGLLTFGLDIVKLLREFRPHVIQVEQGAKGLALAEMITFNRLLGLGAKILFFTWWNLPYDLKFPASALEAYNLKGTDGIVSGNQDGADILRDHGFNGPIRVMPQLGVDETLFRPQPQPDLAASLGISDGDFIVGFVGRFVEEKGLLTLTQALGQIKDHLQAWKWLLLGRGPLKEAMTQQADVMGIGDRIIWVESVPHDDVPRYINLMSTLILASEASDKFKTLTSVGWKEQFGHVIIEAMACQVPVIGSDSGEIPYVIGDTGLVFPEGDADALAQQIRSLMESSERQTKLSKRGYDRAMAHYTNKALARATLDFYRELVA